MDVSFLVGTGISPAICRSPNFTLVASIVRSCFWYPPPQVTLHDPSLYQSPNRHVGNVLGLGPWRSTTTTCAHWSVPSMEWGMELLEKMQLKSCLNAGLRNKPKPPGKKKETQKSALYHNLLFSFFSMCVFRPLSSKTLDTHVFPHSPLFYFSYSCAGVKW